jgi:hypothetical protein
MHRLLTTCNVAVIAILTMKSPHRRILLDQMRSEAPVFLFRNRSGRF